MSNKLSQHSPPLSPLEPPRTRRVSAVSTTNSFQSGLQLQEANSCSLTPITQGAVALVNLPPPLPPKDEPPQLSPGVSDHAFLLDGKFKPLLSPLGADGDIYVVEPVGAIGGRTLYKIAGDKDTVSSPMYLYDAILDEFVLSAKPRRFPTTLKKSRREGGGVGRSLSVPLGKSPGSQQEYVGLDKSGEGGSSSWLHIDVHKPIPIVENGPPSAISSKFTEGALSASTPAARHLVEPSTPHPPRSPGTIFGNGGLYDFPIQQLLLPAPTHAIGLSLTTGYSPVLSRTMRVEIPLDNPSFTDSELFKLLRQEQSKLGGIFRTYFSLRGIRSLRFVGTSGSPRDHFSLAFSQNELLACYHRPPALGRSWTDWLAKVTADELLTLEFVEGWLPQRIFLATATPLAITSLGVANTWKRMAVDDKPMSTEEDCVTEENTEFRSSEADTATLNLVQRVQRWRQRRKIQNLNGRIFVSGFGLFADGYLSGIIGAVNILMRRAWPEEYTPEKQRLLTSITFAGIVLGQLSFGWLVDKFGRRNGMKASGIIIIISSLLTAIPFPGPIPRIIDLLVACRFFTGVGIGGEYPSGSVACAEAAALRPEGTRNRWYIFCTNLMVLGGYLVANSISTAVVALTGQQTPSQCSNAFRILFGIGTIFALIVFAFRRFVDEGEKYEQVRKDKVEISYKTVIRYYWRSLAVESLVWFLWNVTSFSCNIFAPRLIQMIGTPGQSLVQVFGYTACISMFHFPGAIGGAYLSDKLGPRAMLAMGSFCQTLMAALLGGLWAKVELPAPAFIFIFGFFAMFGEAGAGNNISLIVSQSAATPVRGKFYGAAAACGKVGGFIGTHSFIHLMEAFGGEGSKLGISGPFFVCGGIALLNSCVCWFGLRNVKLDQKSLDNRDQEFAMYLEGKGK